MPIDYALLATIHRMLRQKTDLVERLEKGPRRIKFAQSADEKIAAELEVAKQNRTKAKMAADEKQLQLSTRESKIEELKAKLNSAESNREYQLLKDQIAADEQANLVLSDELFELLERIDELDAGVTQAEENVKISQHETAKITEQVSAEMATVQSELDGINRELAEEEKRLPGEIAVEYRRVLANRGENTFSETDSQTCGQCCTTISPQTRSDLISKKAVFCKSCGCILYARQTSPTV